LADTPLQCRMDLVLSDGELELETDRGFVSSNEGAAPVCCGEEGAEPEGEAFSFSFRSQIWVLTQRMRSWIQAAEMSSLQRGAGLSLRDRGRSSTICLLVAGLCRSFWARFFGCRPWGRPRTHWRDYISHLAWEHLRIPQVVTSECVSVCVQVWYLWSRRVARRRRRAARTISCRTSLRVGVWTSSVEKEPTSTMVPGQIVRGEGRVSI